MNPGAPIRTLHHEAMQIAALADKAKAERDAHRAVRLYTEAFAKEREFVMALIKTPASSLTKSVMIRSAATLGLLCGELREAEKLVALGLSMDIPAEIAEELRDSYDQIKATWVGKAIAEKMQDKIDLMAELSTHKADLYSAKGELRMADESKKRAIIKMIDHSTQTQITVPDGLAEIVKIHWGAEVVAWYRKEKKVNVLDRLEPA